MIAILTLVFILTVHIIYGFVEARNYVDLGKYKKKNWVYQGMPHSEYHKLIWWIFFPFICLLPVIFYTLGSKNFYHGFRLLFISATGYLWGGIIEDRLWFVLTKEKLTPKNATWFKKWYKWDFVKIHVPKFYIHNTILGIILIFIYFILSPTNIYFLCL
jgi:hypothetical protein